MYQFDANGRHKRTLNRVTGDLIWSFQYDSGGRLTGISDVHGNQTRIERNGSGGATAIEGPFGQRTRLTVNGDGNLVAVEDPEGQVYQMAYQEGGLLKSFTDPEGHKDRFEYDDSGRLTRNITPTGGGWTLNRSRMEDGYKLTKESAEGRKDVFRFPFQAEDQSGYSKLEYAFATGAVTQRERYGPLSVEDKTASGAEVERWESFDPQFGFTERVLTLPSGLSREIQTSTDIQYEGGTLQSFSERVTVND